MERFVKYKLVAEFDNRFYLAELGMRRAASLSRILPSAIRSRHAAYLEADYRQHELRHNDGINRLVLQFAREGAEAHNFTNTVFGLPLCATDLVSVLAGPLTGDATVWTHESATVPLHLQPRGVTSITRSPFAVGSVPP